MNARQQHGAASPHPLEVTEPSATPPFTSQTWPIAAAMLQFTPFTRLGGATTDATPAEWRSLLAPIVAEGFTSVELSNRWLDLTTLEPARIAELAHTCLELGLTPHGYLVASRSILDPHGGDENLRYAHDSIDAAAELGIGTICMGLHSVKPREKGGPMWFWTVGGSTPAIEEGAREYVVGAFRELGRHAEERGVQVSLEMYPDTLVGTGEGGAALIRDIGSTAVGINPDLGNLIRVQGPIEEWEDVAVATLPLTNYWHVKNYARAEAPDSGTVLTTPTTLETGMIDYRKALRYAISVGFSGTIVAEHYGGDGLGVSATNQRYLRRLLASILDETPGENIR